MSNWKWTVRAATTANMWESACFHFSLFVNLEITCKKQETLKRQKIISDKIFYYIINVKTELKSF